MAPCTSLSLRARMRLVVRISLHPGSEARRYLFHEVCVSLLSPLELGHYDFAGHLLYPGKKGDRSNCTEKFTPARYHVTCAVMNLQKYCSEHALPVYSWEYQARPLKLRDLTTFRLEVCPTFVE